MIYDSQSHTFDHTSEMTQANRSSDLINELLQGMRLRGVQYRRIETGSSFGLNFADRPGHAWFHFVAAGQATLRTRDGSLYSLSPGSAVLIPHGSHHQLLSTPEIPARCINSFDTTPLDDVVEGVNTCANSGEAPETVLFCGCMLFSLGGMQSLGRIMPERMVIGTRGKQATELMPILTAMQREVCSARIGFAGILARLADVVAAMIVRGWIECGCDNSSGLVTALHDPRLANAILALHRYPGHNWTVAELAAECHSSRSIFAERFQTTIGMPPLRYATELRMNLASQWLTQEKQSIETVAQRLGYTSQAAFSRAFKRITGHAPGLWRQNQATTTVPDLSTGLNTRRIKG